MIVFRFGYFNTSLAVNVDFSIFNLILDERKSVNPHPARIFYIHGLRHQDYTKKETTIRGLTFSLKKKAHHIISYVIQM